MNRNGIAHARGPEWAIFSYGLTISIHQRERAATIDRSLGERLLRVIA
jgi:hypothetical protein